MCSAAVVLTIAAGSSASADSGTGSLSAQQIGQKAHDALFSSTSLHLKVQGSFDESGNASSIDLTLDKQANCKGSVSVGGQGSIQIVKRGNSVWIKPDATFWKNQVPGGNATSAVLHGRYLGGSAKESPLEDIAQVCDLNAFLSATKDDTGDSPNALTKGKETTVDGVAVIPLSSERNGRKEILYVAAHGKAYPVRLSVQGNTAHATVGFSDFDKPVPTSTPTPDQTVDLSKLREQVGPANAA
ncbi:hypothetical protein OG204_03565 [Streptomyces sp. NBC_01387]|uniref:hypothetical protein n=1 Tax=unclassified Streptomyces TaxID=2593676 RepID=UPI0020244C47|nr:MULTISPECIES: hypothetical protein [unclassified Streptomyces]WSC23978.1 hypothetical protein OIE60_32290 [Streptomyces sp. NBC_01766]WSV57861.1 hypothetical protein OG282_31555 [Streptomyces sp. NBC_01014]